MQQAALDALGIPARYELWDTPPEDLPARVAALREPEMLGANVTIPHKLAVVPLLDALAQEARVAGAVNTIVRERAGDGVRLVGHNTDIAGLETTFHEAGIALGERRVVVLGAGGAARAVAGMVARAGARRLVVIARRVDAAERLLADVAPREGEALALGDLDGVSGALAACDLLINCTPVGMEDGRACPIPPRLVERMPGDAFVLDIVYTPAETALLRAARAAGLAGVNGLPMLLHQGAAAFELWTGQEAPLGVMRAALGLE